MSNRMANSPYLNSIFDHERHKNAVKWTAKRIEALKEKLKIEAIAFTGQSGAGVAYPVSYLTGIPLICVRKDNRENSHGCDVEQANTEVKNYVIIDDFMETGSTVDRILEKLRDLTCVAIILYNHYGENRTIYKGIPGYTHH